ncbi:MAG: sulfotransferase [Nostocales cyanobacterium 94392]|nr:sulfotransferase [Nostocales cyanobacterium 94392]
MKSTVKPLFIFSLPRSGSTLLQRILASHEDIATVSEPWILLPLFYTLKKQGTISEFTHSIMVQAIQDFCRELPNDQDDYLEEIRSFSLNLYTKASDEYAKYFLDKTPRYHLIAKEIISLFPEAKFVFLWRNPLAIIASMIETWAHGEWNIHYYLVDLFDGLFNLVEAYNKNSSQIYSINYESLLSKPESELQGLCDYLELPFNSKLLLSFNSCELKGTYGDPTGTKQYQSITKQPLEKWKKTLANPIRKSWCKYYLQSIGKERLAVMSYNLDELMTELKAIPFTTDMVFSDLLNMSSGIMYNTVKNILFKRKC